MPRKKLERRVKQIVIRVGNVTEVIQMDSNEKMTISKEERKQKMIRIRKEIKKMNSKADKEQKANTKGITIYKQDPIIKPKTIISCNKKHDDYFSNINLDELVEGDSKNNENSSLENFDQSFDDFFNEFVFNLI